MTETPRVKRWTPGHRQMINPSANRRRKAAPARRSPNQVEALGFKPYFWLGADAEQINLSSG